MEEFAPIKNDSEQEDDCLCQRKWPATVLGLGILALGVGGFAVACVLVDLKTFKYMYHYGVVIDSGSSHMDTVVYKWPSNYKENGTARVEEIGFNTCSDVGLSSLASNPSAVEDVLKKCLDVAVKKIPPKEIPNSHLYFGATAGMRLLYDRDKKACELLMLAVRKTLFNYNINVDKESVRILTGEEEGVSGWISANLLSGIIVGEKGKFDESKLLGALDLGGGSVEMTFHSTTVTPEEIPPENRATIDLYGQEYTLYTHSYLCFGLKEIERKFLARLVQDSGFENNVTNPCYPLGYEVNLPSQYLWTAPCSPQPSRSIFPMSENSSVVMHGGGSYSDCKAVISTMFNKSGCEKYPSGHCSFDGIYQPPLNGEYLAFSGFAYVATALNISSTDSIKAFDDKAKDVCSKEYNKTLEYTPLRFRHKYCFDAVYIYQLLTKGFHFSLNATDIKPVEKIGDSQVGWSLGYMVNATNLIPNDHMMTRISKSEYVAIMAASALLSIIGLTLLAVCCYKNKKASQMGYRRVDSES